MAMKTEVIEALGRIAQRIGPGVCALSFELSVESGQIVLGPERCDLSVAEQDGGFIFSGRWRDIHLLWKFTPAEGGYWVRLSAESPYGLGCAEITSLALSYRPGCDPIGDWRVLRCGADILHEGVHRVSELPEDGGSGSLLSGAFPNSREAGLFLGSSIPQHCPHRYTVRRDDRLGLAFAGTTRFTEGLSRSQRLESEATWVCANKNVGDAIEAYAAHVPPLTPAPEPPVGWSSWDYYFRAISLDDLVENMEEIKQDPLLSPRVKYVVVDDGWQVVWGEWYANHRFPGGLERMAEEIRSRGFIPGIWTAPVAVHALSKTALRSYEFLVKDEYGDPIRTDFPDHYVLDPTHPLGQEFLREIYTRLYRAGFRYYKLDFVSEILRAGRFYDPGKGHYDVLRDLFALVRECVTGESYILGCSFPAECGPGYADAGRIGIDIHNQWSHVEWAVDHHQMQYWLHNRVWVNDPDFLVVRGTDTSPEAETNVLNPTAHRPNPPRWRRGPVFTLDEARTWASLVLLSGGCIFLSDRVAMLNEAGRALARRVVEAGPAGVAARPLDLCDGERPSLWLQELQSEYRLGVINWSDQAQEKRIAFAECGLDTPREVVEFWSGTRHAVRDGVLALTLPPHASAILTWPVSF